MIVIDTSALMAIILNEPEAPRCGRTIAREDDLMIAAPVLTELFVVAAGRKVLDQAEMLIDRLKPTVLPLTEARARSAAAAYRRWGNGFHKAALNLCDSFGYAVAQEFGCPLLFVGGDFAMTDVISA